MSDEELKALIEEIEAGRGVHAPAHMKEEILEKIDVGEKRRARRQLLFYSLEVAVVSAAAVLLILLMPVKDLPAKTIELPREALSRSFSASEELISFGKLLIPDERSIWNEKEDNENED